MKSGYYISSGLKNNFYTLRHWFDEHYASHVGDGLPPEVGVRRRDYHIRNLSIDKEKALVEFEKFVGRKAVIEFDVDPIGFRRPAISAEDRDWSIFYAGKYEGKSIHEVAEIDKPYLLFMIDSNMNNEKYSRTLEMAKALVARELAEIAAKKAKAERGKARVKKLLAGAILPLADMGGFGASLSESIEKGDLPYGRGVWIMIDMLAKSAGRRNSKAYAAKEEFWSRRVRLAAKAIGRNL